MSTTIPSQVSAADLQDERLRVTAGGIVQGVGFRPFVFRLATALGLHGWVANDAQGVTIEVEGSPQRVRQFVRRLGEELPDLARIVDLSTRVVLPTGSVGFDIRYSDPDGPRSAWVLPDIATCAACRQEIFDPSNRRHRYPFTNCTACGPRFSIIQQLPYDRAQTTMAGFTMCPACQAEYQAPDNRRFHAQPNACPVCGPQVRLWDAGGRTQSDRHEAIVQAAAAIRDGAVVAVKGLGGFQLLVDARSTPAVERLRRRKCREAKPLAVMFPGVPALQAMCGVDPQEQQILTGPQAPIVLLRRRAGAAWPLAAAVSAEVPCVGVMLPYTPLHHLLMHELQIPVVATSGNRSDEPMCIDEIEALERLNGIADVFLVHDRPIERHMDDSVVQVMAGRVVVLRRARGYAPLPLTMPDELTPTLAVGAQQKNSVALATGRQVFISQHIGDLNTPQACAAFGAAGGDLPGLYGVQPRIIACDQHPDYHATRMARMRSARPVQIQHHHAHVVSCMADNDLHGEVLGVAWDGTGYGPDHTVWGGEFLLCDRHTYRRVGRLRRFRLPGGEVAVREPRRCAVGVLHAIFGRAEAVLPTHLAADSFSSRERAFLDDMIERRLNCPQTSSMGRLFDAVAALCGVRQTTAFEGQAAMALEAAAGACVGRSYPFWVMNPTAEGPMILDWEPMIRRLLADVADHLPIAQLAANIHTTLVDMMLAVAHRVGNPRVLLTGGCFQNRRLLEQAVSALRAEGFTPYWHRDIPPNDGGIAVGQALAAQAAGPEVP